MGVIIHYTIDKEGIIS